MVALTEQQLIDLWHGPGTATEVAAHIGLDRKWLLAEWHRLKFMGKLPRGDRSSGKGSGLRIPGPTDDRDCVINVGDDPLLAALYKEHPDKAPKE